MVLASGKEPRSLSQSKLIQLISPSHQLISSTSSQNQGNLARPSVISSHLSRRLGSLHTVFSRLRVSTQDATLDWLAPDRWSPVAPGMLLPVATTTQHSRSLQWLATLVVNYWRLINTRSFYSDFTLRHLQLLFTLLNVDFCRLQRPLFQVDISRFRRCKGPPLGAIVVAGAGRACLDEE